MIRHWLTSICLTMTILWQFAISQQYSVDFSHMTFNDTMAFMPKMRFPQIHDFPGMIFAYRSKNWPKAVTPINAPVFVRKFEIKKDMKLLDSFDAPDIATPFIVIYMTGYIKNKLVLDKILIRGAAMVRETQTSTMSVIVDEECLKVHVIGFIDVQHSDTDEILYCFTQDSLRKKLFIFSDFQEWKDSDFKHTNISLFSESSSFQRITLSPFKSLHYMYLKPASTALPDELIKQKANNTDVLFMITESLKSPYEKIVNLQDGLDATFGKNTYEISVITYVVVQPPPLQAATETATFNLQFTGVTTDNQSIVVDCLLNLANWTVNDCFFMVNAKIDAKYVLQIRPVGFHTVLGEGRYTFELLRRQSISVVMFTQKVDVHNKRTVSFIENLESKGNPFLEACGDPLVGIEVISSGSRRYFLSSAKKENDHQLFVEGLRPYKSSIVLYNQPHTLYYMSMSGEFIGITDLGFIYYYSVNTHMLSVDLKVAAIESNYMNPLKITVPFHNDTSRTQGSISLNYNILDKKFQLNGILPRNFPIQKAVFKFNKIDINWLTLGGPLFTLNNHDTNAGDISIEQVDASRLQYFTFSYEVGFVPIDLDVKIGTVHGLFDIKDKQLYNCRVVGYQENTRVQNCLCNKEENFNATIEDIDCQHLLSYSLTEEKLSFMCDNSIKRDPLQKKQYCYHMIDFYNKKYYDNCFGRHQLPGQTKIIMNNYYTYFLANEEGTLKGVYRDWNFTDTEVIDLKSNDVSSFGATYTINNYKPDSVPDIQISIAFHTHYGVVSLNQGNLVREYISNTLPRTEDINPAICSMKSVDVYSRQGQIVITDSTREEYALFGSQLSDDIKLTDLKFETMFCVNPLVTIIFWTNDSISSNTRYYTVLRDDSLVHRSRYSRSMLYIAEGLPTDLGDSSFYVDEGILYLTGNAKLGPITLNLRIPNVYLKWTKELDTKLPLTLKDQAEPSNYLNYDMTFLPIDTIQQMQFNTRYDASKMNAEWNITYKPLNESSEGHFWKVEPNGTEKILAKFENTHRFMTIDIQDIKEGEKIKYKAYLNSDLYDIRMNRTTIVFFEPLTNEEICKFPLKNDVVSIVSVDSILNNIHTIVYRDNLLGSHSLKQISYVYKDGNMSEVSEAMLLTKGLDSTDEQFKAIWVDGRLVTTYIRATRNDSMVILAPNCSNDRSLYIDQYVENHEVLYNPNSSKLKYFFGVLYWRNDMTTVQVIKVDLGRCVVKQMRVENLPVSAIHFREASCKPKPSRDNVFDCIFAGSKVVWIEVTVADDLLSVSMKLIEEYHPYLNMIVDQVLVNPYATTPYFLLRGKRPNQIKMHDGGGILYFEKYNSKFSRGGLLDLDLVNSGISDEFKMQVSSNNTVIVNGNEKVLFYSLQEPVLTGHSLVEQEKRTQIKVIFYGWDVEQVNLMQVPPPPPEKRKSSRSAFIVWSIIAGVAFIITILGCYLIKYIKMNEEDKLSYRKKNPYTYEPGDTGASFMGPQAIRVKEAFLRDRRMSGSVTPIRSPKVF